MRTLPARAVWTWAVAGMAALAWTHAATLDEAIGVPGYQYVLQLQQEPESDSGLALFPAIVHGDRVARILDPARIRVVFTNADDPEEEHVFRAGTPFRPPRGRWRIWAEGGPWISPFSELRVFHGDWPSGRTAVEALSVVPAGKVSLPETFSPRTHLELRLLSLDGPSASGQIHHELSRRESLANLVGGISMPAGPVLAALWNRTAQQYEFLSRPFAVHKDQTVEAPLERPSPGKSFLLVYVDRPAGTSGAATEELELALIQQNRKLPPAAFLVTQWGAYGVWYDLDPGPIEVAGGNDLLHLEPIAARLAPGQITRLQRELSLRPFLSP